MDAFAVMTQQLASRTSARRSGPAPRVEQGQRYGEWTVQSYVPGRSLSDGTRVKGVCMCRCTCGAVLDVEPYSLTSGRSKSCGHATGRRHTRAPL